MKKEELLADLININYENGLHAGRWEDEYNRDETSEHFFKEMVHYAKKYGIGVYTEEEYMKDYKSLLDDGEYTRCNVLDEVGFELKIIIEKKIINEILSY